MRNIAEYCMALHSSAANYDNTAHVITSRSRIPWLSAGNGEEWVAVDLGAMSETECAVVSWGREYAVSYQIHISADGENWTGVPGRGRWGGQNACMRDHALSEGALQGVFR